MSFMSKIKFGRKAAGKTAEGNQDTSMENAGANPFGDANDRFSGDQSSSYHGEEIVDDVTPRGPVRLADSDTITVYDPGSQVDVHLNGRVVTGAGAVLEISERHRELIIASTEGEIYFSRSHQNSPFILSEIKRIEKSMGPARVKAAIDMSTVGELYALAARKNNERVGTRRNDQSAMQRALITMVANAAAINASDIHVVVNQDRATTRFRVDGVMTNINEMQPQYAFELLAAAFAMADASDASYQVRQYQGARISSLTTELPAGVQSLRLQFNPLANEGRYLIMRILYSGEGKEVGLEDLGYSEEQVRQLATMSARPVGINIVSGPTGSGKSTTLKALLEGVIKKRGGEVNTITIEDPPEYVIRSAQQMPVVNAKTQEERAEAFTQAISAGLRSDPNIMMIGEVRDLASADLAVEGALSGHPIYASLHANTAMDILTRLRDMGVDDFKVYDSTVFSGLVGQRLVRQLCPCCKVKLDDRVAELDERDARGDLSEAERIDPLVLERIQKMREVTPEGALEGRDLYVAGEGCDKCSGGYKGRAVVAEIILPDDTFMELMRDGKKSEARAHWFKTMNGIDLLGSSWIRALEGRVSPLDIENEVALLHPVEAHRHAFEYWMKKLGLCS